MLESHSITLLRPHRQISIGINFHQLLSVQQKSNLEIKLLIKKGRITPNHAVLFKLILFLWNEPFLVDSFTYLFQCSEINFFTGYIWSKLLRFVSSQFSHSLLTKTAEIHCFGYYILGVFLNPARTIMLLQKRDAGNIICRCSSRNWVFQDKSQWSSEYKN